MKTVSHRGPCRAAALVSQPVRYLCSLEESNIISSRRHPHVHKVPASGANEQGRITAYSTDFTVDGRRLFPSGDVYILRSPICGASLLFPNVRRSSGSTRNNASGGALGRGAAPVELCPWSRRSP
jgi:hypothetical protein